ncbi:MAG: desulfoferrodoxin family protein [Candidatus Methanomethylophilaceae archaeon]|nr:desulfoferrodoxin family protein [Candidatus Methanomethylophilaceae archaeon]
MAMKKRSVYMCSECKNVVEVLYAENGPTPICCGNPMEELIPKTADFKTEKHVPYIEKVDGGVLVKVGKDIPHPMVAEHYIVYIEICADGMIMRKFLKPGDKPEAFFKTDAKNIIAWELCNVHKLWKSDQ